ncbi:MAG: dTMP kinase [Planctomycetales bacterium]
MFISFDGIDGVGKSTQLDRLIGWLESEGHEIVRCRDPGTTDLGEALREILLSGRVQPIGRRAEMLIYMAARAQLVEEIVAPALAAGRSVVSDRFLLSNVVYQGWAGGLKPDELWRVGEIACQETQPDLYLVLDMDPEQALQRLNRELDRMEQQGAEFRRRLRDGFLQEAAARPERVAVVNADQPVDAVEADVRKAVGSLLERLGRREIDSPQTPSSE